MSKPYLKYIAGQTEKSANNSLQQVNKSLPEAKTSKPTHLRLLQQLVSEASNKDVASRLGVSETTVSQWIAGAKKIPLERQLAILSEAKYFVKLKMRQLIDIDDYIDALELMQYGGVL